MAAPLSGTRIIDATNVLAGPFCTYQLGLLGAEVIKIERPASGDLARQLGAEDWRNANNMGISFLAQNAGKASVTLNLKDERGRQILKKLVAGADVFIENYRPGVLQRLGVGYDALKGCNPELIYCAISGFGQNGPWSKNPAYDQIVQGVAGVMSVTGTPDTAPLRVGYPLADTIGGLTAAFAISAALNARPRGTFLDISMTEAVLSTMGWVVSNYLIGEVEPQAHGNENTTSAPSGTFRTKDHPINIAANRDEQWIRLTEILELAPLQEQAEFRTRADRKRNRDTLRAKLELVLVQQPAAHWVAHLNANGVPCGPVLTVPDALQSAQVVERGLIVDVETPEETLKLTASPICADGQRPAPKSPPPVLGADTDRILADLGYTADEIKTLRSEGVI